MRVVVLTTSNKRFEQIVEQAKANEKQILLRLPVEVFENLKNRAVKENRSVNKQIVQELKK